MGESLAGASSRPLSTVRAWSNGSRGDFATSDCPRAAVGFLTVAAWCLAVYSWVGLYRLTDRGSGLGWDLLTPWRAERIFAHGGAPYAVKPSSIPPSCLLLLRPLGSLTRHQLTVGGLVGTLVDRLGLGHVVRARPREAVVGDHRRPHDLAAPFHRGDARRAVPRERDRAGVSRAWRCSMCSPSGATGSRQAAAIGLSLSVKPLLLVLLLVFLLPGSGRLSPSPWPSRRC